MGWGGVKNVLKGEGMIIGCVERSYRGKDDIWMCGIHCNDHTITRVDIAGWGVGGVRATGNGRTVQNSYDSGHDIPTLSLPLSTETPFKHSYAVTV